MKYFLDIPFDYNGIEKKFDLIVPEGEKNDIPLLVWIHGGGWRGGEKRIHHEFERFLYRGYAVLSIEYRLSPEAPFPAQLIDCKTAIRWARAKADEYGYNADCIIVGGNSAGGHLASMVGLTNGLKEFDCEGGYYEYSSNVQAVVDMFGPANMEELIKDPAGRALVEPLLKNDNISIEEMAKKASCHTYITKDAPPFLIIQGAKDNPVYLAMNRDFYKKMKEAGCEVEYLEDPDAAHGMDTLEFYMTVTNFIEKNSGKK